ncbi:hypothetical protein [Streptomyces sp. NPDC006879]|uniref:hypothetical protein n=1 Tax=Streptomyces sp. NPDC006879 TaxID=3364767 RepID=UPI0036BBAE86
MRISRGAAVLALSLAALTVSCSADAEPTAQPARPSVAAPSATVAADPEAETTAEVQQNPADAPQASAGGEPAAQPVELVRDAFATLQATLGESCTPGNCEYFLGRVYRELDELGAAMKADPKGPGHFPEPLAWIADLKEALGGDRSFDNLKKHQEELIGTRDKINTWMQDHPDDYR